MSRQPWRWLFVLLFGALGATAAHASGPSDLLVAPTRVVFEGRLRTAEITLVNIGSSTATYRISFVHLRMSEEGGTKEIETAGAEPGERFADELIRYSPRQVTLEPNVAQTVRIQVRKPEDLAPGEYRSHLLFRAVPSAGRDAKTAEDATAFSVKLTAIYGVSIPVIVRQGDTSAKATLSDLEIVPPSGAEAMPALRFRISRTGNQSIYGNLRVTFVPAGGKASVVGLANGVAVYTPNPVRRAVIPLHVPPGVVLKNGRLHLAYTKQDKGNETIAEADRLVP
ncbi:MAG TPA: molecular chaperone [Thermoanaerobaculia bacterium]|nr:molecular chaperone [Thermoanaerobaculia bacterium]